MKTLLQMKTKVCVTALSIVMVMLLTVWQAIALGPDTHSNINEYIAQNNNLNNFSLDGYLKNQLGIQEGIKSYFKSGYLDQQIFNWIGDGGAKEDAGFRSFNHFLNPITNKGFNYSAVVWANLPIGAQPFSPFASWNDVRNNYLKALTARDKVTREDYFARTFQGIGQVMHLVEDMSVPAHVRNDIHPPPFWNDGYEDWAKESEDVSQVNYKPVSFTPYNSFFLIPQLFDINRYDGTNPEITTSSNSIGLSEYTNANFFSGDTINAANFPYPKTDSNKKAIMLYTGPEATYNREYFLKDCNELYCQASVSKNYDGYLLSAVDLNDYWRMQNPNSSNPKPIVPILDENVHKDYANLLIPRAIGYSSQVLKYFFRGKMEVKCLPVIEENKIIYVELDIKNATLNEAMTNGKFVLTGKYIDSNNKEKLVKAYYWTPSDGKLYEHAVIPSLNSGQPLETIHFWFTEENEIPVDKWDSIKLTLTYQGKLGNEEGAVIGKVFSPGKLKFNEEWNNGLTGNHNWFHSADNYTYPDCANITGFNTTNQSGTLLVKDNSGAIGSSSGSCGTHFNETTIFRERDTAFPIPITPNTSLQFKIPQMTTNASNPTWDYDENWQIMALWFADGQNTYVFMISLGDQFFYSPDVDVFYFTFDPAFMMIDDFQSMFQLYGINSLPNNLQLIQIDFVQKANRDMTLPGQQKMIVDFVRIIEKGDTELTQTP